MFFCNINSTFKITALKSPNFLRLHNIPKKGDCKPPDNNFHVLSSKGKPSAGLLFLFFRSSNAKWSLFTCFLNKMYDSAFCFSTAYERGVLLLSLKKPVMDGLGPPFLAARKRWQKTRTHCFLGNSHPELQLIWLIQSINLKKRKKSCFVSNLFKAL